jgi:hypothetical protein
MKEKNLVQENIYERVLKYKLFHRFFPTQESNEQKRVIKMQDAEMQKQKQGGEIRMEGEIGGGSDGKAYPAYYEALYIMNQIRNSMIKMNQTRNKLIQKLL